MASASERRAAGVVYTPEWMARYIVDHSLAAWTQVSSEESPLVLDPACGDGIFLQEAYRHLDARQHKWCAMRGARPPTAEQRTHLLLTSIFGVEIDPVAAEKTRRRLAAMVENDAQHGECLADRLQSNIRVGNALIDEELGSAEEVQVSEETRAFVWEDEFSHIIKERAGFDVVLGNPPYKNIRRITQQHGQAVKDLFRRRYDCATYAFDLYVLFLEQAYRLLKRDGCCGMIVPNKIGTMKYAAACRQMLRDRTTMLLVADVSSLRVFPGTGVYPYVLVWQKRPPTDDHAVVIEDSNGVVRHTRQAKLFSSHGMTVHDQLEVETRRVTRPLREVARLQSGTTGFCAEWMAECLRDGSPDSSVGVDFIVSRNIDRYTISRGDVRFMKRRFTWPVLPAETRLSRAKWELFCSPKIVIAGLTRRLEAAYDEVGLALGVQVYAAVELKLDHRYVLALLNSRLMSYLFAIRYQAKRLSGSYLAINKAQLSELPIRIPNENDEDEKRSRDRIIRWASRLMRLRSASRETARRAQGVRRLEDRIDREVYRLYGLSVDEVQLVEKNVAQ